MRPREAEETNKGVFGHDTLVVVAGQGFHVARALLGRPQLSSTFNCLWECRTRMMSPSATAARHRRWRLGRDMSSHEPVGSAGETAVGEESDGIAETGAHQGGGNARDFAHARGAFRPS